MKGEAALIMAAAVSSKYWKLYTRLYGTKLLVTTIYLNHYKNKPVSKRTRN
jgi:hypothetical protein